MTYILIKKREIEQELKCETWNAKLKKKIKTRRLISMNFKWYLILQLIIDVYWMCVSAIWIDQWMDILFYIQLI